MKEINNKRSLRSDNKNLFPPATYTTRHLQIAETQTTSYDPMLELLEQCGLTVIDARKLTLSPQGRAPATTAPVVTAEIARRKGYACIALMIHSSGGVTIHPEIRRRGRRHTHHFEISLPAAMPPGRGAARARRQRRSWTLVLLASALARGLITRSIGALARRWEENRIPSRLLAFPNIEPGTDRTLPSLPHYDGARGLLLIHGIFSSTRTAFGPLFEERARPLLDALKRAYPGRIVGFDHPSASHSPEENARWLLDRLEPGKPCRYDIIASSRGGLIARTLVELVHKRRSGKRASGRSLIVDRALLIGTPNRGTALVPRASDRSPGAYRLLATWLANTAPLLPGPALPWFAEALAQLITWMAHNLSGILPGAAALAPDSSFLKKLNAPTRLGGTLYYAIGANFEAPRGLALKLADAGIDAIFEGADNDLAVPTAGCADTDLPLPRRQTALYSPRAASSRLHANINHFGYLKTKKCLTQIEQFLGIPPAPPRRAATHATARASDESGVRLLRPDMVPIGERPEFAGPMPRLDLTVIGSTARECAYREWIARWKQAIAEASITTLPPEPFPSLLAVSGLSRCVRTFRTRGDGTYWHSLIGTERSMRRFLEDAGPELSLARLADAGSMLYKTLFHGETETLLSRLRTQAQEAAPVLVTLTSTSSWIADLPWEMVYDPRKKRFLNCGDISFCRGVISTRAAVTLPALPLVIRMLIAVAQPRDQAVLGAEREIEGLTRALAPLVQSRRLYINVLEHTSKRSLKRALKKTRYHLLHYIGHGDYDERSDTGTLIFEHPRTGDSDPVEADELCGIIASHAPYLRLILLNGCETAEGGRADFNQGIAPALVASGLPGVIGNRLVVGDSAAVTFSTVFYEGLSHRQSLAEAVMSARRVLASSPDFEPFEWAVPIVFALDPEARFF